MDLKSITKSTYLSEGLGALRLSKDVRTKKELKKNFDINQNSEFSRSTCWTQINKRYLEDDGEKIMETPLVKLVDYGGETLNKELMYFHYLAAESTCKFTVRKLLYPRLSSEGRFELKRKEVKYFLNDYLEYSEATLNKTANSIVKALVDFGIVDSGDEEIYVDFYEPTLITFLYGLYAEYAPGFEKVQEHNILNPSLEYIRDKSVFYKLFFLKPSLLESYLQLSWERGYLGYEPRGGLNQYVLKHELLDKFANHLIAEREES